MINNVTFEEVYDFLNKVDKLFPTPLSEKQDLKTFSKKLISKGTLCVASDEGKIVSMVGGYTENIIDNKAYISVVATLEEYTGRGFAKKLIKEFICMCKDKKIEAVHLYAVPSNLVAVNMYKSIGFSEWDRDEEHRKEDLHLIYRIGGII